MVDGRGLAVRAVRLYLPLGFFLVAMLFPFYWMAITSIKPNAELYNPNAVPLVVRTRRCSTTWTSSRRRAS